MRNKVVIFGLDTFAKKNTYQLKCVIKNNFELIVFTNDTLKSSQKFINKENLFILEKKFFSRMWQIFIFLIKNSKHIHHIEIYPGGRFSIFYLLMSKLFKLKTIVVERGDLLYWEQYNSLYKFFLKKLYKKGNAVWYREPYMKKILTKFGVKQLFFLHNCIEVKDNNLPKFFERDIDFLWVNRFISERKIKWVINIAKKMPDKKFVLIGYMKNTSNSDIKKNQLLLDNLDLENVVVCDYQNPFEYYKRAKFFLLPSDIVFLNNALLEAMSFGCIPIISDVEGSNEIVKDGYDGFIFEHNYRFFEEKIKSIIKNEKKLNFDTIMYNTFKKVKEKFSCDNWCNKYINFIKSL